MAGVINTAHSSMCVQRMLSISVRVFLPVALEFAQRFHLPSTVLSVTSHCCCFLVTFHAAQVLQGDRRRRTLSLSDERWKMRGRSIFRNRLTMIVGAGMFDVQNL